MESSYRFRGERRESFFSLLNYRRCLGSGTHFPATQRVLGEALDREKHLARVAPGRPDWGLRVEGRAQRVWCLPCERLAGPPRSATDATDVTRIQIERDKCEGQRGDPRTLGER